MRNADLVDVFGAAGKDDGKTQEGGDLSVFDDLVPSRAPSTAPASPSGIPAPPPAPTLRSAPPPPPPSLRAAPPPPSLRASAPALPAQSSTEPEEDAWDLEDEATDADAGGEPVVAASPAASAAPRDTDPEALGESTAPATPKQDARDEEPQSEDTEVLHGEPEGSAEALLAADTSETLPALVDEDDQETVPAPAVLASSEKSGGAPSNVADEVQPEPDAADPETIPLKFGAEGTPSPQQSVEAGAPLTPEPPLLAAAGTGAGVAVSATRTPLAAPPPPPPPGMALRSPLPAPPSGRPPLPSAPPAIRPPSPSAPPPLPPPSASASPVAGAPRMSSPLPPPPRAQGTGSLPPAPRPPAVSRPAIPNPSDSRPDTLESGGREALHSLAPSITPVRSRSRAGVYAVLGVGALAALVALVALVALPRRGGLVVTVAGPGGLAVEQVKVLIDGEERCSESPCRLRELEVGAHVVRVVAQGYRQAADKPVRIVAGHDEILELALERGTGPTSGGASGLDVPDLGRHLRLSIDGKDVGALPVKVTDLAPGEHSVRIAGSDRYAPFEDKVQVEAGQVARYAPSLKVLKGLVRISEGTGTAGSRVELVCPGERTLLQVPTTVEVDAVNPCTLLATRAGAPEFRRELTFSEGRAELDVEIQLSAGEKVASAPAPTPAAARPAAPGRAGATLAAWPGGQAEKAAAKAPPAAAPAATAATGKATGQGRIAINSLPASSVAVDGKPVGQTPTSVNVGAGAHTVTFSHPERGQKVVSVNVLPGQTATAAIRF